VLATVGPLRIGPWAVGPGTAATAAPVGLQVSGDQLVDAGRPLKLLGVSRSGTEYACSEGWGIFDGPSDPASVTTMRRWGINAVRVPLNEDCWLGINGLDPAFTGEAYRAAIGRWVRLLHRSGMAVILDLHLTAPGDVVPVSQAPMPDADHSIAFWSSVASTFRGDPQVAFELYNEPRDVSWACWLRGCDVGAYPNGAATAPAYPAAGMQALLDAVRATGATQPVLVEGLGWGNDLSGWFAHPLHDPDRQLVAAFHVYNGSPCATLACWTTTVAPVAAKVPVVITEFGDTDCEASFDRLVMGWADRHGIGYIAWAWDVWPGCGGPTIIDSYRGTPSPSGVVIREHYLRVSGARR
jgi:endoglucanase